jgi:hypothetical protein
VWTGWPICSRRFPTLRRARKIKSNFFISLDGVVESPDQWHFPYFNDEMGAAVGAGFATTDSARGVRA